EHAADRFQILWRDRSRTEPLARDLFEREHELRLRQRVDQAGRDERRVFVNHRPSPQQLFRNELDQLTGGVGHDVSLSKKPPNSARNLSRVADRAGLPAELFTIHCCGVICTTRGDRSSSREIAARMSFSIRKASSEVGAAAASATTTRSCVPRDGFSTPK